MISRDLPGIVSLWVLGTTTRLPCRAAQPAQDPAGSTGRGSNSWLGQHGHTALGKGSLGMGNSLEKKKEATLCLQGGRNYKEEKLLSACSSLGQAVLLQGQQEEPEEPLGRESCAVETCPPCLAFCSFRYFPSIWLLL